MSDSSSRAAAIKSDPRLQAYFDGEDERRAATRAMFDQAAGGYDQAERITALGSGAWYRRDVLRRNGLSKGMTLLDVAAGTGLVAAEGQRLIGPEGRLLALDPSPGMLAELRKKLDVETIEAYAESIPLPDNHVDFVSMGYALRHVGDLDLAFGEYHRVLRPGGRACIMEISRPQSRLGRLGLRAYIGGVVPFLARLTRSQADVKLLWEYYGDTIELAIEPERILDAMRRAGFVDVECSVTFGVFREYLGRKA
ncbi:dimethylmenaquinone methyltransferase [Dechloromonas denitrificans]|uniref:Dimethylmenaquinone methyltransferase n=1 Tax=Dechloromonas denitrificans TaxID=281362 RepID=A0A133XF88_9RHOO|nr:class I SAM-dependent methyltransferase [Dechloromonas denitrificans]KXB29618.1 dimethylmenaquinone methyltransferase [Dechloromonas denitrificans]